MTNSPPSSMRLDTVVRWMPDPMGRGMFASLAGRLRRDLTSQRAVIDAESTTFGGWAQTPQRFVGLAGLAAGRQRAIVNTGSQLVNERSNLNASAMGAFYDRMRRGQA